MVGLSGSLQKETIIDAQHRDGCLDERQRMQSGVTSGVSPEWPMGTARLAQTGLSLGECGCFGSGRDGSAADAWHRGECWRISRHLNTPASSIAADRAAQPTIALLSSRPIPLSGGGRAFWCVFCV